MKLQWPIIAILTVSCSGHPSPVAKNILPIPDSIKPASTKPADTSHPIPPPPKLVLTFTTDLNNDSLLDTIMLSSSTLDTASFDTISISVARFGKQTFHTSDPWTNVDDWFQGSNKNAIATNKFFLAKGKFQTVLLLFGVLDAAGYRSDFSIVNIENNVARLVLNQNERHLAIENPIGLKDLDGDGRLEFLYRQIFEYNGGPDTLNGKIGTYSPYFVYTVDSNCVLNKPLTRRYNEEKYVFAGFKYDESIQVFYPNDNSKPRLWKH